MLVVSIVYVDIVNSTVDKFDTKTTQATDGRNGSKSLEEDTSNEERIFCLSLVPCTFTHWWSNADNIICCFDLSS